MSYDSDIINATSGRGEANWDLIIKLCNRIRDSVGPTSMAQAMGSVLKRIKHSDPNVQLHALTLLEACVSNCGKTFQSELTRSAFETEFKSIITGSYADPRVTQRCKDLLISWANEFKSDSSMSGLGRFVEQLRKEGISFQGPQQQQPSVQPSAPSNEDEDLRRAIEISLRDSNPGSSSTSSSLYPTMPLRSSPTPVRKVEVRKVRAIYDFQAAEDNELSFRAGEIVTVLDSSDENWWKGETQLGGGLFPASFVSSNLSVDPEPSQQEAKEKKKKSKSSGGQRTRSGKGKGKGGNKSAINTEKIDVLLDMIKGADVTSEENIAENETLLELEEECKNMKPLVEEAIAGLQRQEDEMQAINQKFEEALALYRKLLAEGPRLAESAHPHQQTTPTPAALPTTQQYSDPLPPQQQAISISNPPPYHQYSTTSSSTPVYGHPSESHSSLPPQAHPMQAKVYSAGSRMGIEQGINSMQISGSSSGMGIEHGVNSMPSLYTQQQQPQPQQQQQQQQQQQYSSLYTRPQVITGAPPTASMVAPPPAYHPHATLYQPVRQPLL